MHFLESTYPRCKYLSNPQNSFLSAPQCLLPFQTPDLDCLNWLQAPLRCVQGIIWGFTVSQPHQCLLRVPHFWSLCPQVWLVRDWHLLTFYQIFFSSKIVFLPLMSFIISCPKAEQLVNHYIILRNSCLTWLVIFCLFVPATFCAAANPVPRQPRLFSSSGQTVGTHLFWCFPFSFTQGFVSISISAVLFSRGVLYMCSCFALFRCLCIFIWLCCSLKYWWVFQTTKYILIRFADDFCSPSKALLP